MEHPGPHNWMIERIEHRGLDAHGYGRWLDQWRELQNEGWDVTVVISHDKTHSVGLAYKEDT